MVIFRASIHSGLIRYALAYNNGSGIWRGCNVFDEVGYSGSIVNAQVFDRCGKLDFSAAITIYVTNPACARRAGVDAMGLKDEV